MVGCDDIPTEARDCPSVAALDHYDSKDTYQDDGRGQILLSPL